MNASPYMDEWLVEPELSSDEYMLRVEFVELYMRTRNAVVACVELGFLAAYANDWAVRFMQEGVVRRLITAKEKQDYEPQKDKERRNKYRTWLENQASYDGPGASHGARVAAIVSLMKIEGMEAPSESKTTIEHKGGVMLVPHYANSSEWKDNAIESQALLKKIVKE